MLQGGYYIGGIGGLTQSGKSEDVFLENGKIIFSPVDPIYIDDNGDIFLDNGNKNARIYADAAGIFIEKVV